MRWRQLIDSALFFLVGVSFAGVFAAFNPDYTLIIESKFFS